MIRWEQGIVYLNLGLTAAVLWKIWSRKLAHVYKLFFFYLAADLLLTVGGFCFKPNTNDAAYYYFAAQTFKILIGSFVLVEIYSLALERTPALAQFGRNSVAYILAASALFPVVALVWDRSPTKYPLLRSFLLFEQTMGTTMGIFLLLLSIFMAYFPVRMRRNVFFYSSGFIVWALAHSASVALANHFVGRDSVHDAINFGGFCMEAVCLLYWLVGLQKEGEARTAVIGHVWNRAEAARLTDQLDAINNSLERLRRQ